MDNFTKYTGVLLLTLGLFFGFILIIAIIIFLLRLISVSLFTLPGWDAVYHYLVAIVPYGLFSGAYYYLYRKINQSKNKSAKLIAAILLFVGCLVCLICFILASMIVLKVHHNWLDDYSDNAGYNLVFQIVIVFFTAMALGFGEPKEKDWMEKHRAL